MTFDVPPVIAGELVVVMKSRKKDKAPEPDRILILLIHSKDRMTFCQIYRKTIVDPA